MGSRADLSHAEGSNGPFLTVLIPAYNEAAGLAESVRLVRDKLVTLGVAAEILIVNDASRDETGAIAEALAAESVGLAVSTGLADGLAESTGLADGLADGLAESTELTEPVDTALVRPPSLHLPVRVVHHPLNLNIGGAFMTGVREARGEWMILIPADLAMDLDELRLYLAAAEHADVVVGVCPERSDYARLRRVISWLNVWTIRTLFGMPLRQFNYISMYRTALLRRMPIRYWHSAFFFAEVLIRARDMGARLVEVETSYVPRATGEATGANWRLIRRTARDVMDYRLRRIFGV